MVTSTTKVANLNVDKWDGYSANFSTNPTLMASVLGYDSPSGKMMSFSAAQTQTFLGINPSLYTRSDLTGLGLTGNLGGDAATNTSAAWSALPVGYSKMMYSTIGTAGGSPVDNHGYFTKIANRDSGGGWGGLWCGYTAGENYIGRANASTQFATWDKIWTSANNLKDFGTTDPNTIDRTVYGHSGISDVIGNGAMLYSTIYNLPGNNSLQLSTNSDYNNSGLFFRQYDNNAAAPKGTGWQDWRTVYHNGNSNNNSTDWTAKISKANSFVTAGSPSYAVLMANGSVNNLRDSMYTVTVTNVANTSTMGGSACYTRVGNTVHVRVSGSIYTVSTAMSKFTISLPFSTSMTARSIVGTGVVHEPTEPGGRAGMWLHQQ